MADLPVLEDLLLGGYDVSALLAGAPAQSPGTALLGLEAQLQLKASALPQPTLGWPSANATDQNDIYQKVAQSLAAKLEEHRIQQVQVATALQQLQALQQQQELAQLHQQLTVLHQHVPRAANPFQRSRTTDLESLGRSTAYDVASAYAPTIDFEQQKQLVALQHAANSASPLVGLQRIPGVLSQHNLPVRSFSSEHLVAGQRRGPPQLVPGAGGQLPMQAMPNKRPPIRQPSGLGPNGRGGSNNQGRGGDGGRRARYAATAKAPSWASEDWHPMKAVLASGAHASGGTGVFLPHLAPAPAQGNGTASSGASSNGNNSAANGSNGGATTNSSQATAGGQKSAAAGGAQALGRGQDRAAVVVDASAAPAGALLQASPHPSGLQSFVAVGGSGGALGGSGSGCGSGSSSSHSPMSPMHDGSPSCSVDSNAICSVVDPYSRQTTIELSRGSTYSELDSHQASTFGYLVDTMKVVVEEPEREREDATEECDFVSLARELAELMSKQVITE